MANNTLSEIDKIYQSQLKNKSAIKHSTAYKRIGWIKKLLDTINREEKAIEQALYQDFHKSGIETAITEILVVQLELKHIAKKLRGWMKDKKVRRSLVMPNVSAYLHYEPKGNALIITPWNYPFQLPLVHLAACIAAGNTAILKLSEFSPNSNQVLKKIIAEVFPTDHIAVIEGAVEETTHLLNLKFDHIHFTGSSKVGKIVMEAASKHLTDITLELGGKSPAVIDKNVNLRQVVKNLIWAKFINAGQTCIAPDYILAHRHQKQQLEEVFKIEIEEAFGKDAFNSPDYARIINEKQFERLNQALDSAKQLGANIIAGGKTDGRTKYIAPTVITNVAANNPLMTDEIFGPILPIVYYAQIQEAIDFINAKEKPLALYVFSKDSNFNKHIIRNSSAGSTCINDAVIQIMQPNLPFGGVNNSGLGQSTGWYGFKAFSHERAVADVKIIPLSSMFWYPYTEKTSRMLQWIRRLF
ncbi:MULTISPECIES: aldehyde dehydrogenase family protein [unclassified Sphingobacterium]|uniref:aldehyde dehydrogenase family protein n=1 Tax=unclassified Sphingobacterium TaxID=2609468 RepID=UPI0020C4CE99|nr:MULTISPECIES: aldehyde dehydrogenase family protein [unclassified Sphingobacterium]